MPLKKTLQKTLRFMAGMITILYPCFYSLPSSALEIELVEFLGFDAFNMNQTQKEFLELRGFNFNGLLGLRPVFVFSNHVSIEASLGIGFPSILQLLGSADQNVTGLVSLDLLHHFHYPGLYPYFLVGMGYWWHALTGTAIASEGLAPGTSLIARFAPNLGMGFSLLSGLKLGVLASLEGFMGDRQSLHLIFELDYPLF